MVTLDRWQLIHANLIGLIEDQCLFTTQFLAEIDVESKTEVLHAIGNLFLEAVCNLSKVEATHDELNQTNSNILPPCLPQELVEVVQLILKYQHHLQLSWEQEDIDRIVEEHKQLPVFVNREHILWNALNRLT